MAAPKTKARKPAPSKGAAARSEKKGKAKTVDFRGAKLTLPPAISGTILFDLRDIELGKDIAGTMGFLESLVGEDQYRVIRDKVREDGLGVEETGEAIVTLVDDILNASGLSQGE